MKRKSISERFPLPSGDCELLLAFAEARSLAGLSERIGRDASVVSRQLKRLSETAPVIEKQSGRWSMTAVGEEIVKWAREAMRAQASLLSGPSQVSIVTTHEFGARILAPDLGGLLTEARAIAEIQCADASIEPFILSGQAEFGFDCGRPESPLIRYKLVRKEPLCLVAAPDFIRRHRVRDWRGLLKTPYFEYSRLPAARSLGLKSGLPDRVGSFNTVAGTRGAVQAGSGWSILPRYTVLREIRERELTAYVPETILDEQFGVWWLRGNERVERVWVPRALKWLSSRELG